MLHISPYIVIQRIFTFHGKKMKGGHILTLMHQTTIFQEVIHNIIINPIIVGIVVQIYTIESNETKQ